MFHVKQWSGSTPSPPCCARRASIRISSRKRASTSSGCGTSPIRRSFSPSRPRRTRSWVDLGSGAGFPGPGRCDAPPGPRHSRRGTPPQGGIPPPRRRDAWRQVEIIASKVERITDRSFDVISARAFAPLAKLLDLGTGLSTTKTIWVLPKGRNAETELAALDASWQGDFRIEASVTDPDAGIIVAQGVQRRAAKRHSKGKRR